MLADIPIPHVVDKNDDCCVLAGTLYGEIRGGTQAAQENVAQCVLNRHKASPAHTIRQLCLARKQFSCWLPSDVNSAKIMAAPVREPRVWAMVYRVAYNALHGHNPDRIGGATNYFAASEPVAPYWAKPPAVVTLNDGFHVFLRGA